MTNTLQLNQITLASTTTREQADKIVAALRLRYGTPADSQAGMNAQGEKIYHICLFYCKPTTAEKLLIQEFVAGALAMIA